MQNLRLRILSQADNIGCFYFFFLYALGAEHRLCMYATYLIIILARWADILLISSELIKNKINEEEFN